MKKLMLLAVTLLAALNLTACVNFQSQTNIKSDGSGVAQMSMSMSPSIQEALAEMKELDSSQSEDMDFPLMDDLQKDEIEKAAKGHGVKVKKFEKAMVDGRETLEIVTAREQAGLVPMLDVAQARSNLANTEARIPQLIIALEVARNRLAILLGQLPGTLDDELGEREYPHQPLWQPD